MDQSLHGAQENFGACPQPERRADQGERQERQSGDDRPGAGVENPSGRDLPGRVRHRRFDDGRHRSCGFGFGSYEGARKLRQRAERCRTASGGGVLCV